jgi:hypothetical protein
MTVASRVRVAVSALDAGLLVRVEIAVRPRVGVAGAVRWRPRCDIVEQLPVPVFARMHGWRSVLVVMMRLRVGVAQMSPT